VVPTLNQNQFFRFRDRSDYLAEFFCGAELVSVTAHEQLGLEALLQKGKVVGSFIRWDYRNSEADHRGNSGVRTGCLESDRGPEGEAREDDREMKFMVEPIEGRTDVLNLAEAIRVLTLAQTSSAEIKPQNWKSKTIERLHRVKDDLVMKGSAINRMRVTD